MIDSHVTSIAPPQAATFGEHMRAYGLRCAHENGMNLISVAFPDLGPRFAPRVRPAGRLQLPFCGTTDTQKPVPWSCASLRQPRRGYLATVEDRSKGSE